MMNIVRLDQNTLLHLAENITRADARGGSVRIMTGTDERGSYVKWDAGAGWTPPYYDADGM